MAPFARMILAGLLLLVSASAASADQNPAVSGEGVSLAYLASQADVIVLAQARDTDYVYRRNFPVEGSAFLRVLIAYKVDRALDIIEVYDKGLHANECYFPDPSVSEEGRRYLLFLQKDKEQPERYRGLAQGCALDVLVDRDSRYVLRLPVTGIKLSDPLTRLAGKFEYADAYAVENEDSLPPRDRDALLEAGWIEPIENGYLYTSGVALSTIRQLMGENGVSGERRQKRVK